jgi:integrase
MPGMGRVATDSVFFDHEGAECRDKYHRRCSGRWRGVVSLGADDAGKRIRRKVSGQTKDEVITKLRKLHNDLAKGVRPKAGYTLEQCISDYIDQALPGRAAKTVSTYRECLEPLVPLIGRKRLTELSSDDVRAALASIGKTRSSRTVQLAHQQLVRAIRHAESRDFVGRNVAALVKATPGSAPGRPSKSFTVAQARKLLTAAKETRWYAYIVLCIMTGIRTEEARALTWDNVDLYEPSVAVYHSVRSHGDVKTPKSRRKLVISQRAVDALEHQREQQEKDRIEAGPRWQETGLVFTSKVGTALDSSHVRRAFKDVTEAAGLGRDWTPRELRHTFVSVLSASGMPIEQVALLAGHSVTSTTETVYRRQITEAAMPGAEILGEVLRPFRPVRRRKPPAPNDQGPTS